MPRLRAGVLVLLAASLLLLAGCGGDEGDAEEWAGSLCSDVGEWVTDVDEALQSLSEGGFALDENDLREAADRVGDATDELANDLRELEPPEVEAGQQAQQEAERLLAGLREQYDAAQRALGAGLEPLETVARIATALSAAANQLQTSFDRLRELDPAGELGQAFRDSADCASLREQIADIGS